MSVAEATGCTPCGAGSTEPAEESEAQPSSAGSTPSNTLWHYIVVRGDMPRGAQMAQVVHAAGESVSAWANAVYRRRELPPHTRVVVLTVDSEAELMVLRSKIAITGYPFASVIETEGGLAGFTALGLWPMDEREREAMRYLLKPLKLYR